MLTIACYSVGTQYEEEAQIFARSLANVGMPHEITGFPDRGNWTENTTAKAEFIREARHRLRGPLLYIDVDAFVHQNCTGYFDGLAADGYDFGVHWYADPSGNGTMICRCVRGGACDQEHRLLSGTLFFGDTIGARRLCDAWVAKNAEHRARGIMEGGGQKNLWRTVVEIGHTLKMARLPARYCVVAYKKYVLPPDEPVIIEHSIASRENRARRGLVRPERRAVVAEWKEAVGL